MRSAIMDSRSRATCAHSKPAPRSRALRTAILGLLSIMALDSALGATYYWDTNGTTAGSGAATGTWDTIAGGTGSAFWSTDSTGQSATLTATTLATDTVTFSAGTNGTDGVVTVVGTQVANTLTLSQAGLSFSGGTIDLSGGASGALTVNSNATISSAIKTRGISFGVANQTLTLTGGSSALLANGSAINGSSGAISQTSTLNLSAGTFATGGIQTLNIGNATTGTGGVVINAGATFNPSNATFQVGYNNNNGVVRVAGGALNLGSNGSVIGRSSGGNGRFIVDSGTVVIGSSAANDASMRVGFQGGGVGRVDINGGTLTASGMLSINDPFGSGTGSTGNVVNVTGGTAMFGSVLMGGSNNASTASTGSAALNVSGGALYLGTSNTSTTTTPAGTINPSGIYNFSTGTATATVTFSGGTVGARANWSSESDVTITLADTDGGVIFKAADVSDSAHDITLNGVLTGAGSLTKSGGGALNLNAANDYAGGTTVSAGSLVTGVGGTLGSGDITVASGATLTLGNANSIADGAALVFAAVDGTLINLDFTGNETINSLSSISGTLIAAGSGYDADTLNGFFGGTFFAGTGTFTVLTGAIPEPSSYALVLSGLVGCAIMGRRKRLVCS